MNRIEDYNSYLNDVSKRRAKTPFPLPEENQIYMSTGFPNPKTFPIITGEFTLKDGTKLHISEAEMKTTLQYGSIAGIPELRDWLIKLQRRLHKPPLMDKGNKLNTTDLIVNTGCTEGIEKVLEAIMVDGDSLITEEFTYPSLFNTITPLGFKTVPVKSDEEGMLPSDLEHVLSTWNEQTSGPHPKILYCIPSAGNPTGISWSVARKQIIYKIARQYNVLIVEDDPYYMIQFNKERVATFLSMDTDGRVIRLDSVSKVLSAGIRVGYVTGPKQILDILQLHMEMSTVHAGNLAQMLVLKVLEHMDIDGYLAHGDTVRKLYQEKCQTALTLAKKHLTGLAEWRAPHGGMFLWLHLLCSRNSTEVVKKAIQKGAAFTDGALFTQEGKICEYIRISYSLISDKEMEMGLKILASVLQEDVHQQH